MNQKEKRDRIAKIAFGFLGLFLIVSAGLAILTGRLNYSNYWGGVVFAPFAVISGALILLAVIFRWKKFDQANIDKKGRSIEPSKHDDWHKW